MDLTNDFWLDLPVDEAWALLTDVERIVPCMPGAQLQEVEGDEYRGVLKVKVGPMTAEYKGKAILLDSDADARWAVLRAEGRETRGQGNATATVTTSIGPEGDGTRVTVVTDLSVTGRVAQFGHRVMADVSASLLGQFVDCLEASLIQADGGGADGETPTMEAVVTPLQESESVVGSAADGNESGTAPADLEDAPPVRTDQVMASSDDFEPVVSVSAAEPQSELQPEPMSAPPEPAEPAVVPGPRPAPWPTLPAPAPTVVPPVSDDGADLSVTVTGTGTGTGAGIGDEASPSTSPEPEAPDQSPAAAAAHAAATDPEMSMPAAADRPSRPAEPAYPRAVDSIEAPVRPAFKRFGPVVGVVAVGLVLRRFRRRKR
ncbi:hypothetical protein BH18ACT4_BH18ACT4_10360 [soil metagenome]